ncbi:16S rRNA (guanine(527)-N(7))-methyltransferase RsmG [Sphingosinicella sp. BN140058]|uniref:16S rRNA (guanine(527)-N(7))-methyltransferase RsmG n=1 Tax=Sphingosinicella sp. BN140058 TaxID=1892855 RepID=UPI0010138B96|nr:16S rRNA (guanine(527)-N(7))-methyltransferase RsmG [Sphingosinicella sp. BN140058]QAY76883.1 16S rRNA (guanine(527)-N(7))-methyltransferase RsmG [Sphingosinicella sp. BN140058]
MTEDDARAALDVPRETLERLDAFVAYLTEENNRQNLVSRPSLDTVWSRHILDSAQLLRFGPTSEPEWLDLGTGAGFPGLIAAVLSPGRFTLVEARRLRVDFLSRGAELLGVSDRTTILLGKVEAVQTRAYDVISARAFAPLEKLLALAERFSTKDTLWLLPKGRNAKSELDAIRSSWQGDFRLEPSLTDPDAHIIVAREVRRKPGGKRSR